MEAENKFLIPAAIVVAALLIGGAVFYKDREVNAPAPEPEVNAVTADDHILGNPNAPIKVVEFSDIDCPFCSDFHMVMHQLIDEYGESGQVAWVYRHFPLTQLHAEAQIKAESAECVAALAGEDVFWQYLDALFAGDEDASGLTDIAASFGVDPDAFNTCVAEGTYRSEVMTDIADATSALGRGTPYSIILTEDGQKIVVSGAQGYDTLKATIDSLLAE